MKKTLGLKTSKEAGRLFASLTALAVSLTLLSPIGAASSSAGHPGSFTQSGNVSGQTDSISAAQRRENVVLGENVDLTSLTGLIDEVSGYRESDYTPQNWAAFKAVLDKAVAVRDNPSHTQQQVNDAFHNLSEARDTLTLSVYRESLELLIRRAQEQKLTDVKPTFAKALTDAIAKGQSVLSDPDATQEKLDGALYALSSAMLNLPKIVDRDKLNQLIATAEGYHSADYTTVSWNAMETVLKDAKATATDLNNDKPDIDAAYDGLTAAIAALVRCADKVSLANSIDPARKIEENSDRYAPASIGGLAGLLKQAQQVYNQDDATQTQVDAADKALRGALSAARLKADVKTLTKLVSQGKAEELSKYTAASGKVFQSALTNAESVLNNPNATQAEVDSAVSLLQNAKKQLTALSANGTGGGPNPDTGVDSTATWPVSLLLLLAGSVLVVRQTHGPHLR